MIIFLIILFHILIIPKTARKIKWLYRPAASRCKFVSDRLQSNGFTDRVNQYEKQTRW